MRISLFCYNHSCQGIKKSIHVFDYKEFAPQNFPCLSIFGDGTPTFGEGGTSLLSKKFARALVIDPVTKQEPSRLFVHR